MKSLNALAFLVLSWAVVAQPQPVENSQTLCFFSLNNAKEFQLTRTFLLEANSSGKRHIRVVEFHDPDKDANPESSFRSMTAVGQVCDGLVISGHHTGSFGGNRAKGVLDISFLEELSCDPQYELFFEQVNALWLQGCRTLGVGPMALESGDGGELQADYHMQRVGAELIQDGLEQSFADLSFEFSTTLDQDNPLASRYLRVFPGARVFGWTKSSPGEKAGSEKSLLYHMAHMTHLERGIPLMAPLRQRSKASMESVSQSFSKVLGRNASDDALSIEAWLSHGRVKRSGYGFDNSDLNAYAPLLTASEKGLLEAKTLGCNLRNSTTFDQLQIALDNILDSPTYVAYNFNVIWQVFQNLRQNKPADYEALRGQLVSSTAVMNLLNSKLKSPQTGLLMKIEYYSYYRELTGNQVTEVEIRILEQVRYFMLADDLAGSQYDIRDFRESLLLSLASHQLAGPAFYRDLMQSPSTDSAMLYTITWSFLKESPEGADGLISDIISHYEVDSGSLRGAAHWLARRGKLEDTASLRAILEHPKVDAATVGTVASIVARQNIAGNEILIEDIVAHPEADSFALSQVSLAVRKHDLDVESSLLSKLLSHPSLDTSGLHNVSRIIVRNDALKDAGLLSKIIDHQQVDKHALNSVAIALGDPGLESRQQLLDTVRNHPKADARTLRYVDQALVKNRYSDQEAEIF
ncbi:MAG: hypothetical protein OEV47_08700 [Gammaproteobacteria bacterium]|nr:hypothetical protein [Gammaproteobacteria bacterium]